MRTETTIAAALAALLTLVPAVTAVPGAGTVQYKFEKRAIGSLESDSPRQLLKRQTVTTAISNFQLLYLINVTVGSDQQPISLQLDTGSSDIWFPDAESTSCRTRPSYYCEDVSFNPSTSNSFQQLDLPSDFAIQYVDGSQIGGQYFSDTLNLGDTKVSNLTMALATSFDRFLGIMGIGFRAGESSNVGRNSFTYDNIINVLKNQGTIDTLSYSLWLDDLASNTGSILFGGVDTDKYTGSLVALPIQQDSQSGDYTSFTVAWTGLTITGSGNNVNLSPSAAQPAILDSGTTLLYLPDDMVTEIYNGLGVGSLENGQVNTIPCSVGSDDLTFTFEFGGSGGAKINVPISELVLPLLTTSGSNYRQNGQDICQFGIAAAGSDPILFGDTFLRSAYVVYDLENLEIGLAQTNFNANPNNGNVRAISSGVGIPDVTVTASAASVENTFTGRPLRTAGVTGAGDLNGDATRTASFSLRPASSTSSSNTKQNAANRPSTENSPIFAFLAVTLAAFAFGFVLI